MILAAASEYFQFGFGLVVAIIIPLVGLVLSIASLKRRGLNSKCGYSAIFLFLALFIGAGAMTLQQTGGIESRGAFYAYIVAACVHFFSGILGVFGLREMRRRKKWQRGSRRAISAVIVNVTTLGVIACYFYLRLNPHLVNNFFQNG